MNQIKVVVKDKWGDGARVEIIENDYKSIQKLVGGDFEEFVFEPYPMYENVTFKANKYHPLIPKNTVSYCNENGRILDLEKIVDISLSDYLYGPVVMCKYNEDGDMISFSDEEIDIVCKFLDARQCVRLAPPGESLLDLAIKNGDISGEEAELYLKY